jgi:hypothetical protein
MDIKTLTLQELRESRDDLVKLILSEAADGQKVTALEAQIKTLQESIDGYKAQEARQALAEAIAGELKAAGLDPANKTQCSQVFLEDLAATADPALRKAKIDDRKALVGAQKSAAAPSTGSPLQESHDAAVVPPATAPLAERMRRFAK